MTDLHMSLIAAGGIFVVGVISYNKWQEYKARKSVERAFAADHDDVLMRGDAAAEARHEPVLDVDAAVPDPVVEHAEPAAPTAPTAPEAVAVPAPAPAARVDAELDAEAPAASAPVAPAAAAAPARSTAVADDALAATVPGTRAGMPLSELAECLVDPLIDGIIPLALEAPVRGEKLLPTLHTLRRVGNKPVHYIGMTPAGEWSPIVHGTVYTALQAGVQLASRTSPLNELEYSELVSRLRAVADTIGAEPTLPDMAEVVSDARTLHRFVADHDAKLGVNLAANGAPWALGTLALALDKAGFVLRPDGRYVVPGADGTTPLFTLTTNVAATAGATSRLTLLLDVPCVAPAQDGFGKMIAMARALADRLDAKVVDDTDQVLADAAIAEIHGQVVAFYNEMEAADIPAGSTRALRLFS